MKFKFKRKLLSLIKKENIKSKQMDQDEFAEEFKNLEIAGDPPECREICQTCRRPTKVCWCQFITKKLNTRSRVIILQHPHEEKRRLTTVPILKLGLEDDKCLIYKGKKFPSPKHDKELIDILSNTEKSLLLYPSKDALPLEDIENYKDIENLILLDGTWCQAKTMYCKNPILHNIRQAKLVTAGKSNFIIRTQPTNKCLSTLETAIEALCVIENDTIFKDVLLKPLNALCQFQMENGAVKHDSKEYMIKSNKYNKIVGKRLTRLLKSTEENLL